MNTRISRERLQHLLHDPHGYFESARAELRPWAQAEVANELAEKAARRERSRQLGEAAIASTNEIDTAVDASQDPIDEEKL